MEILILSEIKIFLISNLSLLNGVVVNSAMGYGLSGHYGVFKIFFHNYSSVTVILIFRVQYRSYLTLCQMKGSSWGLE